MFSIWASWGCSSGTLTEKNMEVKNQKKVKKKMKKNILYISIIISFIFIGVFTVFANHTQTKFYVDPPKVFNKKLYEGDTFTVNINIDDVTDLKGYEFKLRYDTNLLDATDVTASTFLSSSLHCIKREIDDSEGVIWVACMMPLGTENGVSGSGTLETITFKVMGRGKGDLDLYRTVLGDHTGKSIAHEVEDGSFKNHPAKE